MLGQHSPGDDQYGYEDAGERWMPVHTVESIVNHSLLSLFGTESDDIGRSS
jgi:ubiquitin-conjugating enzyme E2 G1